MTRKCLVFLLLAFSVYKSSAQVLGFTLAEGKDKVEIPIEIRNNLIVAPVIINGTLPLKFIIDTGVRTAILTEKAFSDILNLSYSRKYTISGPGGIKLIDAFVANNVSLELPGVYGRGHALLVLAEDYLELRNYLGTDVHGVLGYELFSRFIVKIDYERKTMTLMNPSAFRKGKKFQTLRMTIEDTKPYLRTEVMMSDSSKILAKLLVDSGASHGLMLEPSSDSLIKVPENTVSSNIGRGLGGVITGKVGRIKSLAIGNYKLDNPIANFPDPNSYFDSLKMGRTSRNGAIGGEILSRFTVVFNFPKEEIYLKKGPAFRKRFHYNLSGITIKAKGSRLNTFEITEVRKKSPAEAAGLQPGDIIEFVNGVSAKTVDLNILNGFFNLRPGKKITIVVNRKGEVLKKTFRLEDQI